MAMTLKVYEVTRHGTVTVVRPEAEVVPLKAPEASSRYPACRCERCKAKR